MSPLADRLTMTLKDDQQFKRELRALFEAHGYGEADAKAAVEMLLQGVRRGPIQSGLGPQADHAR